MFHLLKRIAALTALVMAAVVACPARAATEHEVKSAFIYNFLRFTEWPPASLKDAQMHLCVLGRDSFGGALEQLRGKLVQGRELQVRRVATVDEAASCQAVFIAASEEPRMAVRLAYFADKSILTMSDAERFVERGGMIALTLVDDRVRFEVNLGAARAGKLNISSQVLKIAQRVIDSRGNP